MLPYAGPVQPVHERQHRGHVAGEHDLVDRGLPGDVDGVDGQRHQRLVVVVGELVERLEPLSPQPLDPAAPLRVAIAVDEAVTERNDSLWLRSDRCGARE